MTDEKLKYRAKINSKGLDTTGVGEDLARAMAAHLGGRHLFIVEARAATKGVNEDGSEQVNLVLEQVEPVPAAQEETVREFLRALYRNRPDQVGQAVLTGADEGQTTLAQAAAGIAAATPAPDPEAPWDGSTEAPLEASPTAWLDTPDPAELPVDPPGVPVEEPVTPNDLDANTAAADAMTAAAQPAGLVVPFSGKSKRA